MSDFPTFEEFFAATHHGHAPYLWQSDLAAGLESGGTWPWQVAIPTGMGKTATIAVAVYELARQCATEGPRRAPQRIFHVVDRRTIVDSAGEYAAEMARVINTATDPVLGPIREALKTLLGEGDTRAIVVGRIHGERPDDRQWLRSTGCVVVTMTSHQFVSRLLMRGYGISPSMRPIEAGLCAVDRLALIDEPQLSIPAVSTICQVADLQQRYSKEDLGVPQGITSLLGATIPSAVEKLGNDVAAMEASKEASASAQAAKRINARRLLDVQWNSAQTDTSVAPQLVSTTVELLADEPERVVVFANTVSVAQRVHKELKQKLGKAKGPHSPGPIRLLTSRFRPMDHERIDLDSPGIVVATQGLEVGVDKSFDALVTEPCPWSSLLQRLGRLNRDGQSECGRAILVAGRNSDDGTAIVRSATEAVYGLAPVAAMLDLVAAEQNRAQDAGTSTVLDLSLTGARNITDRIGSHRADLEGESPRVATLHGGMLSLLAQTSPVSKPDFRVDAYISGPDAVRTRDVSVAWRADLSVFDNERVRLSAVLPAEAVAVPRSALRGFLRGDRPGKTSLTDFDIDFDKDDIKGRVSADLSETSIRFWDLDAEAWRVPDPAEGLRWLNRAACVVMTPEIGGYSEDVGWTGARTDKPRDVSLQVALERIAQMMAAPSWREASVPVVLSVGTLTAFTRDHGVSDNELADEMESSDENTGEVLSRIVPALDWDLIHRACSGDDVLPEELDELACQIVQTLKSLIGDELDDVDLSGFVLGVDADDILCGTNSREGNGRVGDYLMAVLKIPEWKSPGVKAHKRDPLLVPHQRQVAANAGSDARAAGLSRSLTFSLVQAGAVHDNGKRWRNFQQMLADSETPEAVLAKSQNDGSDQNFAVRSARRKRLYQKHGIPEGWRHEALSLVMTDEMLDSLGVEGTDDSVFDREMLTHLIGSHHGNGRPILPPRPELGQQLGASGADRFARLNARFGPWGLAYLEAVLRFADWRASGAPAEISDEGEALICEAKADLLLEEVRVTAALDRVEAAQSAAADRNFAEPARLNSMNELRMTGLYTHPLTGWFAAVGLLAAAHALGDSTATLHWEPLAVGTDLPPAIPILRTVCEPGKLVEAIFTSGMWSEAVKLSDASGISSGFACKNQKMWPARKVGDLLWTAETTGNWLVLGIVADTNAATVSKEGRWQIEMPMVPFANNSNYQGVALTRTCESADINRDITEASQALVSANVGYAPLVCDGGMDREQSSSPTINGLCKKGKRPTRVALAPLAVMGMAAMGSGQPDGVGVFRDASGKRHLELPTPTMPQTLDAFRALTNLGTSASGWQWELVGADWVYMAFHKAKDKSENSWVGGPVLRQWGTVQSIRQG